MAKQLVVMGGGSSAHTLIPLLSKSSFEVSVLTSKPELWSNVVKLEYQSPNGQLIDTFEGQIKNVSNNVSKLIPSADYIILCMPVHQYRNALNKIAPFIDNEKEVVIGTVYGQGGFNWMVEEIVRKYGLKKITYFAFGLIPWICRIKQYGHIGITYGFKANNYAAVYPKASFDKVNTEFLSAVTYHRLKTGKVWQSDNFISLTLSVDNQIIHPSRCYGLYLTSNNGKWKKRSEVPMFYHDYDELSAELLKSLDDDYSKIRNKIRSLYSKKDFRYMLNYLALEHFSYNSSSENIRMSFVNSPTLTAIETPVVQSADGYWELDKNHRFFKDDISYGLCTAKWIASKMDIQTPTIDRILYWVNSIMEEKVALPSIYGNQTLDELIN